MTTIDKMRVSDGTFCVNLEDSLDHRSKCGLTSSVLVYLEVIIVSMSYSE